MGRFRYSANIPNSWGAVQAGVAMNPSPALDLINDNEVVVQDAYIAVYLQLTARSSPSPFPPLQPTLPLTDSSCCRQANCEALKSYTNVCCDCSSAACLFCRVPNAGVVSFTDLVINKAGTYSLAFSSTLYFVGQSSVIQFTPTGSLQIVPGVIDRIVLLNQPTAAKIGNTTGFESALFPQQPSGSFSDNQLNPIFVTGSYASSVFVAIPCLDYTDALADPPPVPICNCSDSSCLGAPVYIAEGIALGQVGLTGNVASKYSTTTGAATFTDLGERREQEQEQQGRGREGRSRS